jgi:hypothetical protein
MMNDRFSAQLRQHLLETANDRPAEGQLAAIVDSVAAKPQRRWLAPWRPQVPAWVGGLPATVRYGLLAGLLVLAALAGAILAGGGTHAPSTPFEGSWTTIDVADDSTLYLSVGAGPNPTLRFEDLHATGSACRNDEVKVFRADGVGHINGEQLEATYPNGGGCGLETVSTAGRYVYNPDGDILVDQDGQIWARIPRGDGPLPTLPPEPSPALLFAGRWTAVDGSDGSTLTLVVGEGTKPTVQFQDDLASGSVCRDDEVKIFRADGAGEITGNRLAASYPEGGGCGLELVPIIGRYAYDVATDTLRDADGVTWSRVPAGPGPEPTLRAQASPSAGAEETLPGGCIDVTHGGTYSAAAGDLTFTATIPSNPVIPWVGSPESFFLTDSCERGASRMSFGALGATSVNDSSCMPTRADISGFDDAIARLDTPKGTDISPRIDLTIDGHRAARYDITHLDSCGGFGLWGGTIIGRGETGSIYVIDVDGLLMAIELNRDGSQTAAQMQETYSIVESLQIAR